MVDDRWTRRMVVERLSTPANVATVAALAATAFQLSVVSHFWVNVPFWDEWDDLVGFILHHRQFGLAWTDLAAPHMEHRILTPRLVFLLVDAVYGEASLLGCVTASALLMGTIVWVWVYTLRRLGKPWWLTSATLIVLLSVSQHENMLWGFQIGFYLMVLPVVVAVCYLTLTPTLSWWGVSGLIVAATASTWSMVSGLLAWPVIAAAMVVFILLDRALWGIKSSAQVAAFSATGLGSIALYLHNYSPGHPPGAAPDSIWTMVRWAGFAFSYPLLDPTKPAEANWLPLVMAAEAIPIVAAMAVYIRRRDRPPAVLMTGIVLMVTANVVVMATARSGLVWVASRYGTVCLWGSVAALVAIADLIRMKGTRGLGRPSTWALALLAVSIVAGHAWRYRTFTTAMAEKKIIMVALFDNVSAYLRDTSPTRALRDFEPLPKDRLKVLLDDRRFVRVLPTGLRPGKESPGVALRLTMILVEHARGILLSLLALYGCLMAIGLKRPHPPGKQTA